MVTVDEMRPKLKTLEQVRTILSTTEPISSQTFPVGDGVKFRVEPTWNHGLDTKGGDELVDAFVTLGRGSHKTEHQMSKDGLLEATSLVGLPKGYVGRTPSRLIEPQLNYWFQEGLGAKEFKLLAVGQDQHGAAFTRGTITPFSNLRLLEEAVNGIYKKFDGEPEILVDYKFQHSLRQTNIRLVVPSDIREITGSGTENDVWSTGIQIKNSLIGEKPTSLEGYLFRWWCTNGAIDELATSGAWSRRSGGQGDEIYEWARFAVDEVLGGLEHSLDKVQSLTSIELPGEVNDVLRDVFSTYRIPGPLRAGVIANMVEEENLNMYSVMQAITQVANHDSVDPNHGEHLMRAGGNLAHAEHERCTSCHRLTV